MRRDEAGGAMREAYAYRSDPFVSRFADDRPVIVFEGRCVLCSSGAQFVLSHDRAGAFRLLAAQSELGAALHRHFGLMGLDPNICGLGKEIH